jgi:hypothetical protein
VRIDGQIVGDPASKAAILVVDSVLEPEGKDVGEQLGFYPLP